MAEAVPQNKVLKKVNVRQWLSKFRQFIFGAMDCEPGAIRNGQCLLEQRKNVFDMLQKTFGILISLPAMRFICTEAPTVGSNSAFVTGFCDELISQLFKCFQLARIHIEKGGHCT